MATDRFSQVQLELVHRYDLVANLWVAYHNSGISPDVFGREFYCAVGEIMQGIPAEKLSVCHIKLTQIERIINHISTDHASKRKGK